MFDCLKRNTCMPVDMRSLNLKKYGTDLRDVLYDNRLYLTRSANIMNTKNYIQKDAIYTRLIHFVKHT